MSGTLHYTCALEAFLRNLIDTFEQGAQWTELAEISRSVLWYRKNASAGEVPKLHVADTAVARANPEAGVGS